MTTVYHQSLVAALSFSPRAHCLFRHVSFAMMEEAWLERQSKIG